MKVTPSRSGTWADIGEVHNTDRRIINMTKMTFIALLILRSSYWTSRWTPAGRVQAQLKLLDLGLNSGRSQKTWKTTYKLHWDGLEHVQRWAEALWTSSLSERLYSARVHNVPVDGGRPTSAIPKLSTAFWGERPDEATLHRTPRPETTDVLIRQI